MQHKILLPLVGCFALTLAACGGSTATQPTVDDKSVGTAPAAAPAKVEGQAVNDMLSKRRVYFAFDSSTIDAESRAVIEAHAKYLAANKGIKVVFEGHCDERGTREYNLALGERRGKAVEKVAKLLGVGGDRIKVVSYGEEKPIAQGHDEAAWAQNRRVEIIY
jgi:peptidoglycan-associated lipoprotein